MCAYKYEFWKYENYTDRKPRGRVKRKLNKRVRCKMKREWKKEFKDQENG